MNQRILAAILVLIASILGSTASAAPPGPVNLTFNEPDKTKVETEIGLEWNHQPGVSGYRVYRMLEQVAAPPGALAAPQPGGQTPGALAPQFGGQKTALGWHVIAEVNHTRSWFTDRDIPPPTRRSLGVPHCYKVEAYNQDGSSQSQMICKRMRGLNTPTVGDPVALSARNIRVTWTDNSAIESGYRVGLQKQGQQNYSTYESGQQGSSSLDITGLQPDTRYCVRVRAFDFYGESIPGYPENSCIRTLAAPGTPPGDQAAGASIGIKLDASNGDAGTCNGSWRYRFEPQNLTGSVGQSTTQEVDRSFDGLSPLQVGVNQWECRFLTEFGNFRAGSWKVTVSSPTWNANCTTTLIGGASTTSNFSLGSSGCTHTTGQFP